MASLDIMLNVEGNADVTKLVNNLNKLEAHTKKMYKAFAAGNITMREAKKSFTDLGGGANEFTESMDRLIDSMAEYDRETANASNIQAYAKSQRDAINIIKMRSKALNDRLKEEKRVADEEAKAIEKARVAQERYNAQLNESADRARRTYDPIYAATKRLEEALDDIALAQTRSKMSDEAASIAKKSLKDDYDKFAAAIKTGNMALIDGGNQFGVFSNQVYKSQRRVQKFASSLGQQAGYQIQDFLVQIQSGQDILVAFGQQGSQLAGVFGTRGAIIGAFIAAGTAIAGVFKAMRTDASETAEAIAKSFGDIESVFSDLGLSIITPFEQALDRIEARYGEFIAEIRKEQIESIQSSVAGLPEGLPTEKSMKIFGYTLPKGLQQGLLMLGAGFSGSPDALVAAQKLVDEFTILDTQVKIVTDAFKANVESAESYKDINNAVKELLYSLDVVSPTARDAFKDILQEQDNQGLLDLIAEVEAEESKAYERRVANGLKYYGKVRQQAVDLQNEQRRLVSNRLTAEQREQQRLQNAINKAIKDGAAAAERIKNRQRRLDSNRLTAEQREQQRLQNAINKAIEAGAIVAKRFRDRDQAEYINGIKAKERGEQRLAHVQKMANDAALKYIQGQKNEAILALGEEAEAMISNVNLSLERKRKEEKAEKKLQDAQNARNKQQEVANEIQFLKNSLLEAEAQYGKDSTEARAQAVKVEGQIAGIRAEQKGVSDELVQQAITAAEQGEIQRQNLSDAADEASRLAEELREAARAMNALYSVGDSVEMALIKAQAQVRALSTGGDVGVAGRIAGLREENLRAMNEAIAAGGDMSSIMGEYAQTEEDIDSLAAALERLAESRKKVGTTDYQKLLEDYSNYITGLEFETKVQGQLVGLFGEERDIQEELIRTKEKYKALGQIFNEQEIEQELRKQEELRKTQEILDENRRRQQELADAMEGHFEDAFMSFVDHTKTAEEKFKEFASAVISDLYRILVVQQMVNAAKSAFSGGPLGFLFGSADGNAFSKGNVVPYANGGVVGSPTYFPMAGGRTGLMGEAGPEAIMPLKRGKGGKLGVQVEGSTGDTVNINQTINVSTGVQQTVRTEIKSLMPQIAESAKSAVMDAKRRGGSYGRSFA